MPQPKTVRRYGRQFKRPGADPLFVQLPGTPAAPPRQLPPGPAAAAEDGRCSATARASRPASAAEDSVDHDASDIDDGDDVAAAVALIQSSLSTLQISTNSTTAANTQSTPQRRPRGKPRRTAETARPRLSSPGSVAAVAPGLAELQTAGGSPVRELTWHDVCGGPGDRISKVAEASSAEVYRVGNGAGTSIVKALRLAGWPVRRLAAGLARQGRVDEAGQEAAAVAGELRVSGWVADVPGCAVYKARVLVRGPAPPALRATHAAFHRRSVADDPDRLQFYPCPSRYTATTRFLLVELGDAGVALDEFALRTGPQLWDVLLRVAVALARAEAHAQFEHRDLHEGNVCVRQGAAAVVARRRGRRRLGGSGLEVTMVDYGLSRATEPGRPGVVVAPDLDRDPALFAGTHAPHCDVYRRMRRHLAGRPWSVFAPYTNVLWLGYLHGYLLRAFRGPPARLTAFRSASQPLATRLDADEGPARFESAGAVVRFAVEQGWVGEEDLG